MEREKRYYVYIYLDPSKPGKYVYRTKFGILRIDHEPFYIGKGIGERYKVHFNLEKCGNWRLKKIMTNLLRGKSKQPIIKFVKKLFEKKALELEAELVKIIGRKILKEGPLSNIAEGGGQPPSASLWKKEIRLKKSEGMKKLWADPEWRRKSLKSRRKYWKNISKKEKEKRNLQLRKAQKRAYSTSESIERASERMKVQRKDPVFNIRNRKAVSKRNRKDWKDPKYRKKMITAIKLQYL